MNSQLSLGPQDLNKLVGGRNSNLRASGQTQPSSFTYRSNSINESQKLNHHDSQKTARIPLGTNRDSGGAAV